MQENMSLSHAGEGLAVTAVFVHKPGVGYLQLQALFHTRRLCAQEGTRQLRACGDWLE